MAGAFEFSSTRPRTISNVLLAVSVLFLLLAAPMIAYGVSMPSTVENEMLPFILLLCGMVTGFCGVGMLVIAVRLRRRYPAA